MGRSEIDAQAVLCLAEANGLAISQERAARVATAVAGLFGQAEALRDLPLDGVEPSFTLNLEVGSSWQRKS